MGLACLLIHTKSWCIQDPPNTYDIHDARAKEKHKGILMMVIMDLQPWSMVNDPGFLYFSSQMDPHYKVASDKFYACPVGPMMVITLERTLEIGWRKS